MGLSLKHKTRMTREQFQFSVESVCQQTTLTFTINLRLHIKASLLSGYGFNDSFPFSAMEEPGVHTTTGLLR